MAKVSTGVTFATNEAAADLIAKLAAAYERDFVTEAVDGVDNLVSIQVVGQTNSHERECMKAFVKGLAVGRGG